MRKPRRCKMCHERPASVPDRENPRYGRRGPTCEVCSECHEARLRGDLLRIVQHELWEESQP